ncbi:aminotransferase class I/II-fold pyridoxal phosphate-dependent enzyme [Leucobacter chromiireducens]|uniref:aminotransferase class I/II-fold pyridoxal phosphate-dependent enzyme n=1 Tax=Leucobacter chromiireducens TaxID=283877 RepID=UPI003F7F9A4E
MLHHDSNTTAPVLQDGAAVPTQTSAPATAPRIGAGHERAPYAEALQRFADSSPLSFMVPGHGNDPEAGAQHLAELYGPRVPQLDVPLMLSGIDLGDDSPLVEAQRLAADAWGAKRTWFLTNGASQANRTAAIAVRGLGERILIQRSMHSSLTDGVLLSGLIPSFVSPNVDERHGIAHGLTPQMLDDALRREAEAGRPVSSVLVVSPSYFGSTADVAGLAEVAHAHDAAIIVDGAWGAHFGFHPELPESPARLGADLVISSTHKLAGSLTQSAMLHLGHGPYAERLEPLVARAFSMTASTSMSGILMSSLDTARRALVIGEARIGATVAAAKEIRERLRADERFAVISDGFDAYADITETDLLRVPIDVSRLGQSGHWVRGRMTDEHGVYLEMSTATSVVAVLGALRTIDVERFMTALSAVADEAATLPAADAIAIPSLPEAGPLRVRPRDAYFSESEVVPAADAIGRISADTLAAYPPGIPNLLPGEEITADTVAFLQAVAASPTGYVRGAVDSAVAGFRVLRGE